MPNGAKTLVRRMAELQSRLAEAEETINAIRSGSVDALVVHTARGEQLFTLKGADHTYRALVEAMSQGAVTLNNGIISYCNRQFAEMLVMPMEDIFGANIFDLIPSDQLRRLVSRLQKGPDTHSAMEAELKTADGRFVPVLLSCSRFHADKGPSIGLVVTDISARKEAERVRQELSRSILVAQEQERQRVARDLHDSVTQLLASAKYRLNSILNHKKAGDESKSIQQVLGLVEKAIAEVRAISRNLRPSELDDLGLVAAMRALTREFEKRSSIAARFKSSCPALPKSLTKEVEMMLYRIAQESLNNVEKHSSATKVLLTLKCSPDKVTLAVEDDGHGFKQQEHAGWGLQNMAERAIMLKGNLEVKSLSGKGTTIAVSIPLEKFIKQEKSRG